MFGIKLQMNNEFNQVEIGRRIKNALRERGIKQNQLIGIGIMSESKLSKILKGEQAGGMLDYILIANRLNWTMDYLLFGKESWESDARKPVMEIFDLLKGESVEFQLLARDLFKLFKKISQLKH